MSQLESWADPSLFVKQIHVEESCLELPYTREILARTQLPYTVIPDYQDPEAVPGFISRKSHCRQTASVAVP